MNTAYPHNRSGTSPEPVDSEHALAKIAELLVDQAADEMLSESEDGRKD